MPFIVACRTVGQDLSSAGDFWRLRGFKDGFHERFWIKMARYVAAGAIQQKKYGTMLLVRNAPLEINLEAQVKAGRAAPPMGMLVPRSWWRRVDKGRADDVDKNASRSKQAKITCALTPAQTRRRRLEGLFSMARS